MNLIRCSQVNLAFHQSKLLGPGVHSYGERMVEEYEFDYILSSDSGKMITEGETVPLQPGMFFVRKPGTKVEGITHYSSWYVRFRTEDPFSLPVFYCHLPLSLCNPVFQKIYDLHLYQPKDYQYRIDYQMNTLLYYLYQETTFNNNTVPENHPLAKICKEMEHSWNKKHSLDYYVTLSGYSKSRFCHLFKEVYQISPIQFLQRQRLKNVCCRLIETDQSVKEIMIENGFRNEQSFFRAFKEYTGETPLDYRKKHRF